MAKITAEALYTGPSDDVFQTGHKYEIEIEDFAVRRVISGDNPFKPVVFASVSAFLNNWTAIHVKK